MDRIARIKDSLDIRHGLNNQVVGLTPLLLLVVLNYTYTYLISYLISSAVCLVGLIVFWGPVRRRRYQFMLLPTAVALALYSLFFVLQLGNMLADYSPLVTEWLLVVVLSSISTMQRVIVGRVRRSRRPALRRTRLRTALNEFFFVARITQNAYTIHLFIILFYKILPEADQTLRLEQLLQREFLLAISLGLMLYEQIRLSMMKRGLAEEAWLPVVDVKGHVIGRVAYSVSLSAEARHYRHPVVRIAVMHRGMLYLSRRDADRVVSPEAIDHPFCAPILFGHTPEQTVRDLVGRNLFGKSDLKPRLLIRYAFDNERVSRLVSLYVIHLRSESTLDDYTRDREGKLWTTQQIEDNLRQGLFSEYFEQEYPSLRQTALQAEQYLAAAAVNLTPPTEATELSPAPEGAAVHGV